MSSDESNFSAAPCSTGAADHVEEDFNRNEWSRATGYMGKNSVIRWIQRLKLETNPMSPITRGNDGESGNCSISASPGFIYSRSSRALSPEIDEAFSASATSYHLDDLTVSVTGTVDPYVLPTRAMADELFNVYLSTVHPSFPIIGKSTFSSQYERFFSKPEVKPGDKWLGILNMIFAISVTYSYLARTEWQGHERDHLIYFSRARILSMNGDTMFSHPDLQQVQISGLISFYLLATNQVNR
jgi:hypothetical protein